MAFVYRQERNLAETQTNLPQNLGPGSYIAHEEYQINPNKAPFNLLQDKNPLPSKKNYPGPGTYNHNSFGDDSQKVVLNSGASDVKIFEIPKPNANFQSITKRFSNKPQKVPGPGAYEVDLPLKTQIKRASSQSKLDQVMKLSKYQSIPSIPGTQQIFGYVEKDDNQLELNKNTEIAFTGVKCDTIGPGQYESQSAFNTQKGTTWSRSNAPKINDVVTKDRQAQVPPGTYDPQFSVSRATNMGFRSKSQRIFDQRRGEQSQRFQQSKMEQLKSQYGEEPDSDDSTEYVEDTTPGPGHYFQTTSFLSSFSRKPEYSQQQMEIKAGFQTQQQRFREREKSFNVGPGKYEVQQSMVKPPKAQKYPGFHSSNTRFEVKKLEKRPGPQLYNTKQTLEDGLINKLQKGALGSFGSNIERFKLSDLNQDLPGPGKYIKDKEIIKNQLQPTFKSTTTRKVFEPNKNSVPPYDVENFTIEKATKVEVEEDPDLAPKRQAFNTSVERFKFEPKRNIDDDEFDDRDLEKNANELFMKKAKKGVPFQSSAERFNYNSNEQESPGPGEYKDHIQWNKRTYNIIFAEIKQ